MSPRPTDRVQVERFLRLQPWFATLPTQSQEGVIRESTTLRASRGELILNAGEAAQGWYAVLGGFVKLQSPAPGDQVAAFLALTGGEWFGEGSAMNEAPRRYEAVALRDSELLCVPRAQFQELLATSLPFANAVLRHMNQRLGQAMAIIEATRCGSPEQRLALYLGPLFWHGLRPLNLNQEELGCLAGMSRQTTNRTLQSLAARGLVTLRHGRVAAVDPQGLQRLAVACGSEQEVRLAA